MWWSSTDDQLLAQKAAKVRLALFYATPGRKGPGLMWDRRSGPTTELWGVKREMVTHIASSLAAAAAAARATMDISDLDVDDPAEAQSDQPRAEVQSLLALSLSDVRYRCLRRGVEYSISDTKEHLVRSLLRNEFGRRRVRHHVISASARGDYAHLLALLRQGANPNESNEHGTTALMEGCVHGRTACVRLLLEHEADVDAATDTGQTALMRACRFGALPSVQMLCAYGASRHATDADGWSAEDHGRGKPPPLVQANMLQASTRMSSGQIDCVAWLGRTYDYTALHLVDHLTAEQLARQLHSGADAHALATRRSGCFTPLERAHELLASHGPARPGWSGCEAARLMIALHEPCCWQAGWLSTHSATLPSSMRRRAYELLRLGRLLGAMLSMASDGAAGTAALADVWSVMIVPLALCAEYCIERSPAVRGFAFGAGSDWSGCSVAVAVQRTLWCFDPRGCIRCDVRTIVDVLRDELGVHDVGTLRAALNGGESSSVFDRIRRDAATPAFVVLLKGVLNGTYAPSLTADTDGVDYPR
jgi:hypothetical protein